MFLYVLGHPRPVFYSVTYLTASLLAQALQAVSFLHCTRQENDTQKREGFGAAAIIGRLT